MTGRSDEATHYQTLGTRPGATTAAIKKAYIAKARKHHPDLHQGVARRKAESRMRLINEAWSVLSDPRKREIYDLTLPMPPRPGAAGTGDRRRPAATPQRQSPQYRSPPRRPTARPGVVADPGDDRWENDLWKKEQRRAAAARLADIEDGRPLGTPKPSHLMTAGPPALFLLAMVGFVVSLLAGSAGILALSLGAMFVSIVGFALTPIVAMARSRETDARRSARRPNPPR